MTISHAPLAISALLLAAPSAPQDDMGWTGVLDEASFAALHDLKDGDAPPLLGDDVEVAGMPSEVVDALLSWEDITTHPEFYFLVSDFGRTVLDDIITITLATDYNTNAVFWLFILRTPNIYTGPFGAMFEKSLVFKIINLITCSG